MPVGSHALTYNIADQIWRRKPATVLDLGVGFGMHGVLVRQYVDQGVQPFRTQLIGVEAFPKYRNAVWDLYDVIFEREIIDFLAAYRQCLVEDRPFVYNAVSVDPILFDMILMSDVIEHFDKSDGYQIAQDLMSLVAPKGTVLIGTPGVFLEQGAVYGNEYERHRSLWGAHDFPPGYQVIQDGSPDKDGHTMVLVRYTRPVL